MNVIVSGGAGFIGSHLVRKLLDNGNEVLVIDNMSIGSPKNLPKHENLTVWVADILDNIDHFFKGIDVVYHLAAQTRPQSSILKPEMTNNVNVGGTLRVLMACHKYKVKRIVFTSSSAIYGEQEVFPTQETAIPHPMSPYALTKYLGEQYCQLYDRMYGLEFNIIRPFNVYGTRQNPNIGYAAAIPKFIDCLSKGETPFITKDGNQSRDYIHVSDLVDLMIAMATSKVHGEAFNGGYGVSISINDLYKTVSELMGKDVKPDYIDSVFEPSMTLSAIDKAEYLLNWKPKIDLEEGLKLTIKGTK